VLQVFAQVQFVKQNALHLGSLLRTQHGWATCPRSIQMARMQKGMGGRN
jgi:hypothetical protein